MTVSPPNDMWIKAAAAKRLRQGEDPRKVAEFITLMVEIDQDPT